MPRTAALASRLIALLATAASVRCASTPHPVPLAGAVIQLRRERACNWLQFRASVSAGLPVPLHELVVAVNGEVCHREGVPGNATVYGEVAALCPVWFEPGWNQVEIALVPPGCGMRPLLSRRVLCAAPEPD